MVLDFSSQKDAASPAKAVVDGLRRTAWISDPSVSFLHYLGLGTADGRLYHIAAIQLCTGLRGPYATMAVRSITLFGSKEVEPSRTLFLLGNYTLSQRRRCHRLTFAEQTMRLLVVQINQSAGDSAALVAEVTSYGEKR